MWRAVRAGIILRAQRADARSDRPLKLTVRQLSEFAQAPVKTVPYLFARFYGSMLGRSRRNTPQEACRDAIAPYMIIVGVPGALAVLVLIAALFPRLPISKDWVPWITVPLGILLYLRFRTLQRYAQTPEVAEPFSSRRNRLITTALFFGVLIGSVLAAGLALRFIRHNH
jgi:hypothetical protein